MSPRVVVVGAGKMGAHHARVFGASSVFDVDREACERVARARGASVAESFEDAIEASDLVVIAAPTSFHFDQAARALHAGKHVLVEKPLAATSAEARELVAIAKENGVKIFAGHSERFNSVVQSLVRDSAGEEILSIETQRSAMAEADDLCLNLAVHDIDLVALLANAPATFVSATGSRDDVEIVLRAGRVNAVVRVSRSAEKVRAIRMQTTRNRHDANLLAGHGEEPLLLQARATLDAIAGKPSMIATGEDGARAVEIAELASVRIGESRHFAAE